VNSTYNNVASGSYITEGPTVQSSMTESSQIYNQYNLDLDSLSTTAVFYSAGCVVL